MDLSNLSTLLDQFLLMPFWDQAGALAALAGLLTTAATLTAWITRRAYRPKLSKALEKIASLENLLKNEKEDHDELREAHAFLKKRLVAESPVEWLTNDPLERNRVAKEGLELITPDLRASVLSLAEHYISVSELDKHSLLEADRLLRLAQALRPDNDVASLRDEVREIQAGEALERNAYDPEDPQWSDFDFVPKTLSPETVSKFLVLIKPRIKKLLDEHEPEKAERLAARAVYIARIVFPTTDLHVALIRESRVETLAAIGAWEATLNEAEEVAAIFASSGHPKLGPDSSKVLMLRHVIIGMLYKLGQRERMKKEVRDVLPLMERTFGNDGVVTKITRSFLESSGNTGDTFTRETRFGIQERKEQAVRPYEHREE